MTPVFFPRYEKVLKLPPSPRWNSSQGPSSRLGNSMDSPSPSPCASGSLVRLSAGFSQTALRRLHIKLPTEIPRALFSSVHGGGHTTNVVGVVSQDYKPTKYKHGAHKHLWMRGMQTSLATRPKPRASAYESGLTNLSASQSTYANHQVIL